MFYFGKVARHLISFTPVIFLISGQNNAVIVKWISAAITKKINEPVGEYFNLSGHKWEDMEDMTVVIIDHNLIERTRKSKKKVLDAQTEIIQT